MTPTRWIIFAVIVIVGLAGLVYISDREDVDVSEVDHSKVITEGPNADRYTGNPDAKVVIVEYADFQCPGCRGAYPNLKDIKNSYGDDIAFVYRYFPLTSIHPHALAAAAVAEAAGKQDKFWEMHDLLFERQDLWSSLRAEERTAIFEGYARDVALNIDKFNEDIASAETSAKINFDRALGTAAGVESTPTVFLNGELMPGDVIGNLGQGDGQLLKDRIDTILNQ